MNRYSEDCAIVCVKVHNDISVHEINQDIHITLSETFVQKKKIFTTKKNKKQTIRYFRGFYKYFV